MEAGTVGEVTAGVLTGGMAVGLLHRGWSDRASAGWCLRVAR
jgi:hypothetical protein